MRDYVHVSDLARAHVQALDGLAELGRASSVYNLDGGSGYSVREVIEAAREVTGRPIPTRRASCRPGDPAVLVASWERARRELGWEPRKQDLRVIVEDAWRWRQNHPAGYASATAALAAR